MSKQRAKGTVFENLVVQACRVYYPQAHRNPPAGSKDVGDVWTGDFRFILECKNYAKDNLPRFIREAKAEAKNLNPYAVGVVVTKRRGSMNPMDQIVHMELGDFLELVAGIAS